MKRVGPPEGFWGLEDEVWKARSSFLQPSPLPATQAEGRREAELTVAIPPPTVSETKHGDHFLPSTSTLTLPMCLTHRARTGAVRTRMRKLKFQMR